MTSSVNELTLLNKQASYLSAALFINELDAKKPTTLLYKKGTQFWSPLSSAKSDSHRLNRVSSPCSSLKLGRVSKLSLKNRLKSLSTDWNASSGWNQRPLTPLQTWLSSSPRMMSTTLAFSVWDTLCLSKYSRKAGGKSFSFNKHEDDDSGLTSICLRPTTHLGTASVSDDFLDDTKLECLLFDACLIKALALSKSIVVSTLFGSASSPK